MYDITILMWLCNAGPAMTNDDEALCSATATASPTMAERMKVLERERKANMMALEDKRSKLQEIESQRLLGS